MTTDAIDYKLIVSSAYLSRMLDPLKGLIEKNPILPILTNFLFELDADHLTVTASDVSVYLSTEIIVDTKTDNFSVCVPAKLLTDLLGKVSEQPLRFVFNDDLSVLTIFTDNGEYELPLSAATDWPESSEATPGISFDMDSTWLAHALGHTTFATSDDALRPAMTCVCIESNMDGLRFVATDGFRLVKVERPNAGIEPCKALLPRKAAGLLSKLLSDSEGTVSVEVTPTTIRTILPSYTLQTRQVDGDFPDITSAFTTNPYPLESEKAPIIGALKRLLIFANDSAQVRFDLEQPSTFTISAENIDWSKRAHESIENSTYQGDDLAIGFNGKLLIELLDHVDGPLVEMDFLSPNKGVIVREKSLDSDEVTVTSLMMPLMLTTD